MKTICFIKMSICLSREIAQMMLELHVIWSKIMFIGRLLHQR